MTIMNQIRWEKEVKDANMYGNWELMKILLNVQNAIIAQLRKEATWIEHKHGSGEGKD